MVDRKKAFEGIKVLDFCNAAVGPMSVRYLTYFGATTIRVESHARLCTTRTGGPFKDRFAHPDHTAFTEPYNSGKLAITLNLTTPKGIEIAWKLIKWADVVANSFTPGVMDKHGFDYESIRKVKPDIIYMSINAQGQDGPQANFRGYGMHLSALASHFHFTGWPDREPSGIYAAYNDFIAPRFGGLSLMAALAYRQRTGKGQCIGGSQVEAGANFMAPMIMDYTVNGRVQARNGNRVAGAAPHGAYRCKGDERWIAIAVTSDAEWESFKRAIGEPAWTSDAKFATLIGRKGNEDELDRLVEEWTTSQVAERAMEQLQQAGVPAGVVWNGKDLHEDPQLKHRGYFVQLEDRPNIGSCKVDGPAIRMSKTTPKVERFFGPMGFDNEYVYKEIVGLSDEELADCLAEGVFE